MPTPEAVFAYLAANKQRYVEELNTLLRFPTVSTQTPHRGDVRACAEWLRAHLTEMGLAAEICETPGHPVVLAATEQRPGRPTVLVYGHYDVQPAEPFELWQSPPFEPTIRDGKVYARGATDDKGQMFTHLKAIEAWLKTVGELPINVKLLIEGEEEIGSPNLGPFVSANRERLACDCVVISDTAQYGPGIPAITYGLRGILCYGLEFTSASGDLHSGVFGGVVPNPLHAAVKLLAALHDANGRVTIPGFYDDVEEITAAERAEWAKLPFDEEAWRESTGAKALTGEKGYSVLERRWARPTLEINGIGGGYFGEGFKTVLPARATAKVSMRLVPNQDPQRIAPAFEAHIQSLCPDTVRLSLHPEHFGKPALTRTDSPEVAAASRAIERGFGTAPVLIREGGSIPIVTLFKELLGADSLLLGWGQNDDGAHAPNEKFSLDDYQAGIRSSAALFGELG